MRFRIWLGIDVPDGSQIPVIGTADGFVIIEVSLCFAEEKNVLVAAGWPIFDALWLAVRFVPDDVGAKKPSRRLQCEC